MFQPSKYQIDIFRWVESGTGNAICSAVAGSGKSTTLIQAAKLLKPGETGLFLAFNAHIVKELATKLQGTPMIAQTIHSTAKRALDRKFGRMEVDDKLLSKILDDSRFDQWNSVKSSLSELLRLGCVNLVDFDDYNALWNVCQQYGIELPYNCKIENGIELTDAKQNAVPFFEATCNLLHHAELLARNAHKIDFTGMIYWPVRWDISFDKFDWIFLDECQDLSALQREIALRCVGKRALAVGDRRQAIYAFAGASSNSFSEVKNILNATELPLSVCYRCPTTHLDIARLLVPEVENSPTAQPGIVQYVKSEMDIINRIEQDNITLILCRKTAPLITACIKAIGQGIKAKVRGRDVSKGLTKTVKATGKLPGFTMDKFGDFLHKYENDQVMWLSRREGNDEKIQQLSDQVEAILACYDRYKSPDLDSLTASIEALFADDNDKPEVWFSTVHRAKGLEADNVAILEYSNMPLIWKNQRPDQYEQELNIKYVALTRAKNRLVIHGSAPASKTAQPEPAITQAVIVLADQLELVVTATEQPATSQLINLTSAQPKRDVFASFKAGKPQAPVDRWINRAEIDKIADAQIKPQEGSNLNDTQPNNTSTPNTYQPATTRALATPQWALDHLAMYRDPERQAEYAKACKYAETKHVSLRFGITTKAYNWIYSNRENWREWKTNALNIY